MTYNSNTSCLCSSNISKSKLNNLNNLNILSSIESIPSLSDIDADINLPYQCNFKYYLTHDFYNSQEIRDTSYTQESFSILHCNIRSLTANVDSLSNLLTELSHSFSIKGLSETKLLVGKDPIINTNLPHYHFISNPTLLSAGSVGMYNQRNDQIYSER